MELVAEKQTGINFLVIIVVIRDEPERKVPVELVGNALADDAYFIDFWPASVFVKIVLSEFAMSPKIHQGFQGKIESVGNFVT